MFLIDKCKLFYLFAFLNSALTSSGLKMHQNETEPEYFVLDLSLKNKRQRTSSSDDSDVDHCPRDTNDRQENLYKSLSVLRDDLDDPHVVRRGIHLKKPFNSIPRE